MRIQRGQWRNQSLKLPKHQGIRPTTARVRQRLFDTLQFYWPHSVGVDAFAGSGVVGLEALGLGAESIYACETHPQHRHYLKENLSKLGVPQDAYHLQAMAFEDWWQAQGQQLPRVDWLFCDPPYGYTGWDALIQAWWHAPCVQTGGLLILETGNSALEKQWQQGEGFSSSHIQLKKHLACGESQLFILERG